MGFFINYTKKICLQYFSYTFWKAINLFTIVPIWRFYFITDKVLNNNLEIEKKSISHAKGFLWLILDTLFSIYTCMPRYVKKLLEIVKRTHRRYSNVQIIWNLICKENYTANSKFRALLNTVHLFVD